jgi:nucleotide-binding universal stress UspA family protein
LNRIHELGEGFSAAVNRVLGPVASFLTVVRIGTPHHVLADLAVDLHADAIDVSGCGHGLPHHALTGSTTARLLGTARGPVRVACHASETGGDSQ